MSVSQRLPSLHLLIPVCFSLLLGIDEEKKEIACGLVDTIGKRVFFFITLHGGMTLRRSDL